MTPEKKLQNDILREFATRPDMRLWRSNTGISKFGDRFVSFGIKGQADMTGIVADGRRLEIEAKAASKQTPEQAAFQKTIVRFGGIYILARSIEDVIHKGL